MESLWPKFEIERIEVNEAVSILREQARHVQKETNNKVRATFSKMEYKLAPMKAVQQLGQVITAMNSSVYEEIIDDELKNKTDANNMFKVQQYKFEIFNDEYRFRLFILNNSEMFPINLEVDGGILEEIGYKNKSNISSNAELKEIVKEIFSCPKVYKVITKMLEKQ